jgi:hypothetical protein
MEATKRSGCRNLLASVVATANWRLSTSPKESELLHGMVNCYNTCHANFEETVGMVGSARGLSSEEVKTILQRLKQGQNYSSAFEAGSQ